MTGEEAKRQFTIFAILRIGGVVLFLLGIAIAFTDLLRPGGWKLLGGILVIAGAMMRLSSARLSFAPDGALDAAPAPSCWVPPPAAGSARSKVST